FAFLFTAHYYVSFLFSVFSFFFFFFFSSRRRHTRSKRDWSSDVCSSDLLDRLGSSPINNKPSVVPVEFNTSVFCCSPVLTEPARSEERRVGKECRSRWSAYQ